MTGDEARDRTPEENWREAARSWIRRSRKLKELQIKLEVIEADIVSEENTIMHARKELSLCVDAVTPRRVFQTQSGLVMVERVRAPSKKKRAGSEPLPIRYRVEIGMLEVEE